MPLISRVPEFMMERDLTPTDLHDDVVRAGRKISYNNAHGLRKGEMPGMQTVEKLCDTYKCQPFEFVLWEE